jgi:hypothetical protein
MRMTAPLPNCFSIWPSAALNAFLRFSSIVSPGFVVDREASCLQGSLHVLQYGTGRGSSHESSLHFFNTRYLGAGIPVSELTRANSRTGQRISRTWSWTASPPPFLASVTWGV